MSSTTRGSKELTDSCRHMKRITTETAGLERAACEACGHVSMKYLYDVFEEMCEQIEVNSNQSEPLTPLHQHLQSVRPNAG